MGIGPYLKSLVGQKVALDTMIFIYAFEENATYLPFLRLFFREVEKGRIQAVTSTITILECLVQPFRAKAVEIAARYKGIFRGFPHLTIIQVTEEIAERAAWLRARYPIRTPDAIQLATALDSGSTIFLTNDEAIPKIENIYVQVLKFLLR